MGCDQKMQELGRSIIYTAFTQVIKASMTKALSKLRVRRETQNAKVDMW